MKTQGFRTFWLFARAITMTAVSFIGESGSDSNFEIRLTLPRNIKGFMIQTGDPSGTGKGGDSIWGGPFNDEIRPTIKVCELMHFLPGTHHRFGSIIGAWWPWQTRHRILTSPSFLSRMRSNLPLTVRPEKPNTIISFPDPNHSAGKYTIFGRFVKDLFHLPVLTCHFLQGDRWC